MIATSLDVHRISTALGVIPADDRDLWVRLGMAIKSELGDAGFEVWDVWSRTASNYNPRDAQSVWRSLEPTGGVTIGSLFHEAQQHGFQFSGEYQPYVPSPSEIAERHRQAREVEAKKLAEQAEAAQQAQTIWAQAVPAPTDHPYLQRKQIQPHGLRVDANNQLLAPVTIGNTITSVQFIDAGGDKKFLKNGAIKGGSFTIGNLTDARIMLVGEGFATMAMLNQATGYPVVVAFNEGNLRPVVQELRRTAPTVKIVLCADNDFYANGKPNTGVLAATEAADAIGGIVATPDVIDNHKTDWNDVGVRHGLDAVRAGIDRALSEGGETMDTATTLGLESAHLEYAAVGEDPEPISLDALDVPSFPTSLLPAAWLQEMVEATAAATETPVELALLLSLAVIATTIQRTYRIEPEPGYIETLNLWIIVALDSGNRKTAVLREVTDPLREFERRQTLAMVHEVAKAESARRLAEDRIKYLRTRAAKASGADLDSVRQELFDEEAALTEVPKAIRLWTQDVTPEQLGQLMADHDESMAILSDEGGLFDILAGRYSQGVPNLDLFLQAHSGAPYRVDRGSRPAVFMESPVLTIGLSPQPAVLKGLAKQPGFRGRGLLARPLIALPHSTLGHRTLAARPVPDAVRQKYADNVQSLLTLAPRGDGRPHRLRLSLPAYQEWKAFQRHVEDELRDGGTFEHIRDWASKLPGGVARLAGVLHCAVHVGTNPEHTPVSLATMEAALTLGGLLEKHALAAFSLMSVDSALDAAQKVWAWILRQRQPHFSRRDCHQALRGAFPDLASIQPAFDVLVERGYLFPLPLDKRVGRPSQGYRVNSRIARGWA